MPGPRLLNLIGRRPHQALKELLHSKKCGQRGDGNILVIILVGAGYRNGSGRDENPSRCKADSGLKNTSTTISAQFFVPELRRKSVEPAEQKACYREHDESGQETKQTTGERQRTHRFQCRKETVGREQQVIDRT